jgi:hypothetical protein
MLTRPCLPIPGSTELPAGFAHPHASEEARRIAEDGMILRAQVGSGVHGTSVTYTMHALRLGLQGIELVTTGRITLPVPAPHRDTLRAVRRGELGLADVLDLVTGAEARLAALRDSSALPEQPDRPGSMAGCTAAT